MDMASIWHDLVYVGLFISCLLHIRHGQGTKYTNLFHLNRAKDLLPALNIGFFLVFFKHWLLCCCFHWKQTLRKHTRKGSVVGWRKSLLFVLKITTAAFRTSFTSDIFLHKPCHLSLDISADHPTSNAMFYVNRADHITEFGYIIW